MITHIVLFKMKSNVCNSDIHRFYGELYVIKEKIEGIISIKGGHNISLENFQEGYSEGFVMEFENEKYRDDYLVHEEHIKLVKNFINPIVESVLVFDF